MEKEDYSLATAALETLPASDPIEFASWCASPDLNTPELRAYVAEYQEGFLNINQLPAHLQSCEGQISELLERSRGETEWGVLTTDDAIIKISDSADGKSGKLLFISEYYFSELTNYLLAQILLSSASTHSRLRPQAHADDTFFRFVDKFMGPYVRASVIQHSANERYRVIEIGDPDGYPVVCVHHLAVIHFSDEEYD